MKYITAIVEPKYMEVGGFGHVFYDVLTAYIISKLLNIKFVYSPISSLGAEHHSGLSFGSTRDKITWDTFLQFNNDELNISDIESLNLNKVEINLCEPFTSMTIQEIETAIKSYDDNTLFILTNNNRMYLNELYYFKNDIYNQVFSNLKNKLAHLKKPRDKESVIIAMHIRRGDWDCQPLSYNVEFIKLWQAINKDRSYKINIYSLGTEEQLQQIADLKTLDKNISFYFDTDVFETFSDIYNSDIVVGGHSNFAKIITMFSDNVFIYLPYNDGIIPALGVNNTFELYHLGHYPELFDEENRIETDIYCKKNRQLLIKKLSNL